MKEKTKGVLIFAFGHSNYYHMAEILAASLIVNGAYLDGIRIALVCDNPIYVVNPSLFTDVITLNREDFTTDGKVVFNDVMVKMYDITPFDMTVKLDADMVWISDRKVSTLFNDLKDVDLTFENTGFELLETVSRAKCVWADPKEIKSTYGFTGNERCYTIFGEFLYFRKSNVSRSFFSKVKKIYKEKLVKCADFANGTFTDELAFQIAIMQTNKYPHKDNFTPIFNIFLHRKDLHDKYSYQLPANFYAYSIGGNSTPGWQKQQYNILANHYFSVLGLQNPYQATNKRSFLPERIKL